MKLLLLIHRLPVPADRGTKLRAALELRHLTGRHDVWCAGFLDVPLGPAGSEPRLALDEIRELCRDVAAVPLSQVTARVQAAASMLSGRTATEGYFASAALERQVLRWAREVRFDAVLAFSSSMAPLALKVDAPRRVLDLVDLDSFKWREMSHTARWPMRWVYGTEGVRLARRELDWMDRFDASLLINDREAALLSGRRAMDRLHVIRSGAFTAADHARIEEPAPLPDEPVVGFLGAMDYAPNIEAVRWFVADMWPGIRQARPDAVFHIIGRSPGRAVRRLHNGRDVLVSGTVPAVEPYLRRLRVSVAPLRLARGIQTKVLAAMAAGRPCVVTPCVAAGIGADETRELLVADSAGDFVRRVVELLDDKGRADSIGRAGAAFVSRAFDPRHELERLDALLTGGSPARETAEVPVLTGLGVV